MIIFYSREKPYIELKQIICYIFFCYDLLCFHIIKYLKLYEKLYAKIIWITSLMPTIKRIVQMGIIQLPKIILHIQFCISYLIL